MGTEREMDADTVTLYAVWAEKDFVSMTFDAGEGSFADDSKEKV